MKKAKKKQSPGAQLFLALVVLLQIVFTLLLHIVNRQETLKAVKENEDIKLLLKSKEKTTRTE